MTAVLWVVAAHLTVWTAMAVLAWRHYRASAPRVEPQSDDMDAIARAVTTPRPVLTVYRLHTGALDLRDSDLTVSEAITVGERCIQGALAVQYRSTGIHQAETFANGEQT